MKNLQLDYAHNEARLYNPATQDLSVRLRGRPSDLVAVLDDLRPCWESMYEQREFIVEDSVQHFGAKVRLAYADWWPNDLEHDVSKTTVDSEVAAVSP